MGVISFHSLEDRIVKTFLRDGARGCVCPPDLPICGCGREPLLRVLTPRVVRPGEIEIEDKPALGVRPLPRRRADRGGAARYECCCAAPRPSSRGVARPSAAASQRRRRAAARAHPRGRSRRVVLQLRDRRHRRAAAVRHRDAADPRAAGEHRRRQARRAAPAVHTDSANLRASLAKAHPRSEVEAFARAAGMIRPDVDAYQTVRVRAK